MTVDCHAHYVGPEVVEQVSGGAFAPAVRWESPPGRFRFPSGASRPFFAAMTDLDRRRERMDQLGVDRQLLSTWVDVFGYDLPPPAAVAYHRAINEGLARASARDPRRFGFLASVPLPHGQEAARELERAVRENGAAGAMIGTNIAGRNLDDPALAPFFAAAAALGVPVVLHPVAVAGAERLQRYYLENLLGNPFDTAVAAAHLIFGGVLDRHPTLTVVLLHGGGYFPFGVGRLDHGYRVRPEAQTVGRPPSEYLRRFYYDGVVYRPGILAALAGLVGADRIMLGTDYPFDMEPPDAPGLMREALGDQAAAALERAGAVFGGAGRSA